VNQYLIRYADVILWAAECEAQDGSPAALANATTLVNKIRNRAKTSRAVKFPGFKKGDWEAYLDPASRQRRGNYVINLYPTFIDKPTALKAVHMERKLELAMEGHRFFDVVRWGETTMPEEIGDLQQAFDYNGSSTIWQEAFNLRLEKRTLPDPQTRSI